MSVLLRPDIPINNVAQITLVAGLAVCQAVTRQCTLYNVHSTIKWPNDILINGKKVAGILTELTAEADHIKALVVGIGVNVHISSFPPELAESATSLLLETEKIPLSATSERLYGIKITSLAAAILNSFEPLYDLFIRNKFISDILPLYQENCVTLGRDIRGIFHNREIRGRAVALNPAGELIVQLPTGETLALNSSEVSVRGIME